ncbi:unnamed protein product [Phaeothamnion confervicola]
MLFESWDRASRSYEIALERYRERIETGEQPSTPIVDLFRTEGAEKVLVFANVSFILISTLLYLHMQQRPKPLEIKGIMLWYNCVNVCISAYVAYSIVAWKLGQPNGFQMVCNPVVTDVGGRHIALIFTLFYLQKYWQLFDTYFFVMRKSFRQVTFLHLFHHSSITVIVGSVLPFDFNGDMFLPILLNSSVHVLVYSHYILTALGLHAWWSPYLTSAQLGQFAVILAQSLVAFWEGPRCGSPDFVKVLLIFYMASMLVLFGVFFTQRYIFKLDAVDTCGVIKSAEHGGGAGVVGVASSWHGNARLDDGGAATVRLPPTFHASQAPVMYCYHLTPVGESMPQLHVSKEVTRTLKGHKFVVSGGAKGGLISWMVASVPVLDRVPH